VLQKLSSVSTAFVNRVALAKKKKKKDNWDLHDDWFLVSKVVDIDWSIIFIGRFQRSIIFNQFIQCMILTVQMSYFLVDKMSRLTSAQSSNKKKQEWFV